MHAEHRDERPSLPSFDFEQRIARYALAAAAAGVGVLAASQPAEAKIVYTPANQHIAPNTTINLDLNNDGIADFNLKDTFSTTFFSSFGRLLAVPVGSQNQVAGHFVSRRSYASAFFSDAIIGPKGQFLAKSGAMASVSFLGGARPFASSTCTAPWANVHHRYLGLKFIISGEVHFGWARLDVGCSVNGSEVAAELTGYAYETVANRPILTGRESGPDDASGSLNGGTQLDAIDPGSLAHLAQGASALSAWRRKPY